jgi:hypothetical protein
VKLPGLTLVPYLIITVVGLHISYLQHPLYIGIDLLVGCFLFIYFQPSLNWVKFLLGVGFLSLGVGHGKLDQIPPRNHYSQLIQKNDSTTFELEIIQKLRPNSTAERFYAKVKYFNKVPSKGKLLII